MERPDNHTTIVTYAVLAGLTPLIPVPFVDDVALRYFKRHMVRSIAGSHASRLNEDQVRTLIDDASSGGFVSGVVGSAVKYPLKKVFRKVFYFLEWKRAVDTASRTYYQGFLLDHALAEGWCEPAGGKRVAEVRAAVDKVLTQTDTRPIERTIAATFQGFKGLLGEAALYVGRKLSAQSAKGEGAEQAVAELERQEGHKLGRVIDQLKGAIAAMPAEHFAGLRKGLAAELG